MGRSGVGATHRGNGTELPATEEPVSVLLVSNSRRAWKELAPLLEAQGFHAYLVPSRHAEAILKQTRGDGPVPLTAPDDALEGSPGVAQFDESALMSGLTPRELEVLAVMAEGTSGRGIAERLSISPHTVRTHVQHILAKLQVGSRLEAVSLALQTRMTRN